MEKEWISVNDRLPNDTGWYKVKLSRGEEYQAPYTKTMSGSFIWLWPEPKDVTHWMPLPQQP